MPPSDSVTSAVNPYWWAQPSVTILAALLALAAAGVALWGVSRQIKANADNVQRQIDAASENIREQLAAAASQRERDRADEWRRLLRIEHRDRMLDVHRMSGTLYRLGLTYRFYTAAGNEPEAERRLSELKRLESKALTEAETLELTGMQDVADSIQALVKAVRGFVSDDAGAEPIQSARASLRIAIEAQLRRPTFAD